MAEHKQDLGQEAQVEMGPEMLLSKDFGKDLDRVVGHNSSLSWGLTSLFIGLKNYVKGC